MIPGNYDLEIFQGGTYISPLITLPDLSSFGGPTDLTSATLTSQIRAFAGSSEVLATFTIEVLGAIDRQLRLHLTATQTSALSGDGEWDLNVSSGSWVGTPLRGAVSMPRRVTR